MEFNVLLELLTKLKYSSITDFMISLSTSLIKNKNIIPKTIPIKNVTITGKLNFLLIIFFILNYIYLFKNYAKYIIIILLIV